MPVRIELTKSQTDCFKQVRAASPSAALAYDGFKWVIECTTKDEALLVKLALDGPERQK